MKQFKTIKTIQLAIFLVITVLGLAFVFTNDEIFHMIATNGAVMGLSTLLWFALLVQFVFIYIDFASINRNRRTMSDMETALKSDPSSGIANRYSCDMIIEKYLYKPLPKDLGCIMIDITNIREINDQHGHVVGNDLIREFSQLLLKTAAGDCFVGRNGGNRFMAIFEDCTDARLEDFEDRVAAAVAEHNAEPGTIQIRYSIGSAFREEGVDNITDLVAMANRHKKEM